MMAKMSDSSGGQYPVFENEPLYLRDDAGVPLHQGHAVSERGDAARRASKGSARSSSTRRFRRSRSCTRRNISTGVKPTDPKLPDVEAWRTAIRDWWAALLGELEHRILIEQAIERCAGG